MFKKIFFRGATFLFLLQIVHLCWLTGNVVFFRLFGISLFPNQLDWLVGIVDYTEIPALVSVSLIYINDITQGHMTKKAWLYLALLNTQWLHLFWITDEIVVEALTSHTFVAFPLWLAWLAIAIDYLELPVMYDTIKKTFQREETT